MKIILENISKDYSNLSIIFVNHREINFINYNKNLVIKNQKIYEKQN